MLRRFRCNYRGCLIVFNVLKAAWLRHFPCCAYIDGAVGPAAPSAPVGPVGPVAPAAPAGPDAPVGPVGPGAPAPRRTGRAGRSGDARRPRRPCRSGRPGRTCRPGGICGSIRPGGSWRAGNSANLAARHAAVLPAIITLHRTRPPIFSLASFYAAANAKVKRAVKVKIGRHC